MRSLTFALIAVSVLLSSGGVAIRSSADPATPSAATPAPIAVAENAAQNEQDAGPQICRPPQPVTSITTLPIKPLPGGGQAVQLNTRGYNYQRPGDAPSFEAVPAKPTPVPPAAPKN